jgi:hypothetical protein
MPLSPSLTTCVGIGKQESYSAVLSGHLHPSALLAPPLAPKSAPSIARSGAGSSTSAPVAHFMAAASASNTLPAAAGAVAARATASSHASRRSDASQLIESIMSSGSLGGTGAPAPVSSASVPAVPTAIEPIPGWGRGMCTVVALLIRCAARLPCQICESCGGTGWNAGDGCFANAAGAGLPGQCGVVCASRGPYCSD